MAAVLWILAVIVVGLAVLGPKRYYWGIQAPFRRNPQATEPSDLAYGLSAVTTWLVAGVLVIAAIAATVRGAHVYSATEVRSAADRAAADISADPQAGELTYSAAEAIRHAAPGKLTVTDMGDAGDTDSADDPTGTSDDGYTTTDLYLVTNSKGQHPVCLSVSTKHHLGDDSFDADGADADVTDGPCTKA